ncbi:uracil phosphoribosyltransferase [Kordia sp.]|uniref:uracil phosphoribosyltransferase n=1 Tax=Kordia sp. TaxID=1965332 RepID=UPI003D28E07C
MNFTHFTEKKAAQLLATQSRRADINAITLCDIHVEMGKFIAYEMLEEFELTTIDIQHVQGIKSGVDIANKDKIVILPLMRAGLYAAEGIRSVFVDSHFIVADEITKTTYDFTNQTIIIVDAVINTGKSIENVLHTLLAFNVNKIIVVTLILQKEALQLIRKYPTISFYALRISENKYVGTKGTDTGNRLFNTKKNI